MREEISDEVISNFEVSPDGTTIRVSHDGENFFTMPMNEALYHHFVLRPRASHHDEYCDEYNEEDCEDCEEYEDCEEEYMEIKEYCDKSYRLKFDKGKKYRANEEELFIGFEVEFELPNDVKNSQKEELAKKIKEQLPDFIAECKHDGSLNNGFEAVSHPIHISKIMTKWFRVQFETLSSLIKSYNGAMCTTTGLHFHVNNTYLTQGDSSKLPRVQAKLLLMMNNWYKELQALSGRFQAKTYQEVYGALGRLDDRDDMFCIDEDNMITRSAFDWKDGRSNVYRLFSYCMFMPDDRGHDPSIYNSETLRRILTCDHGVALNCSHWLPTTEFRFFAGTLDFNVFFANIELVIAICRLAVGGNYINKTLDDILKHTKSYEYYKKFTDLTKTRCIDYNYMSKRQLDKLLAKRHKLNKRLMNKLSTYMTQYITTFAPHVYFMRDINDTMGSIYWAISQINNGLRHGNLDGINYGSIRRNIINTLFNTGGSKIKENTFKEMKKQRNELMGLFNEILVDLENLR